MLIIETEHVQIKEDNFYLNYINATKCGVTRLSTVHVNIFIRYEKLFNQHLNAIQCHNNLEIVVLDEWIVPI